MQSDESSFPSHPPTDASPGIKLPAPVGSRTAAAPGGVPPMFMGPQPGPPGPAGGNAEL